MYSFSKIEKAKADIVTLNDEIIKTEESIKETIKAYQLTDGENVYLEYVFDATSYEDLVKYGSEKEAKDNGKVRLEGKEYLMQDGDICYFRFNV